MTINNVIGDAALQLATEDKVVLTTLDQGRINRAKAAYNARRVRLDLATHLLQGDVRPQAGDLVLASIESIGQHTRIELTSGRRAHLFKGDEVIVCYGARYAPDQFESYVPESLERCHLVAAGGVASLSVNRHKRMKAPTAIQPLGLLADASGRRLNLKDWGLPEVPAITQRPYTVAVVGTAMNAGKTTTAASLVRGLKAAGHKVGAAKVTGTGAGGDRWAMIDSGADQVLDFTDAGVASTFGLDAKQVERIFARLTTQLAMDGAERVVLEVADGLYQQETAALLTSPLFAKSVDAIVFAAGDALGAKAGVEHLKALGLTADAISGVLTASPLAIREAAQVVGVPVVSSAELSCGAWLPEPVDADPMFAGRSMAGGWL